ncbi:Poly [ADP-ribose] polymerase 3 [Camelus dromedarius]|uniref:Poly [ADP-ribose] polymerase 3 n=1 Tax=Camelus dromedarius TaxID=9838 RepID=A0A5N4CYX1_CAMDR|nr:Poly [ADP-ribose] polymerase 3 [Camelus dromedarius]
MGWDPGWHPKLFSLLGKVSAPLGPRLQRDRSGLRSAGPQSHCPLSSIPEVTQPSSYARSKGEGVGGAQKWEGGRFSFHFPFYLRIHRRAREGAEPPLLDQSGQTGQGSCDWRKGRIWVAESWVWSEAGREEMQAGGGSGRSPKGKPSVGQVGAMPATWGAKAREAQGPPLCPRIAMAPKCKPQVQHEGLEKKRQPGTEEEDNFHSTAEALRAAPTEKHVVRVDPLCPLSSNPGTQLKVPKLALCTDYDCILNQTNIASNNKFYIIQLLEEGDHFVCWNRWGRVSLVAGRGGPVKAQPLRVTGGQKKDFEKKFRNKTENIWAERDHFVAHPSKYTLIEVQREDEAQEAMVKKLITNIFSKDMFKNAMALMNLATTGPPPTNSPELLQAKKDMLLVLAKTLKAAPEETKQVEEVPHPLDQYYQLLKCQLQLLDPEAPEYQMPHRGTGLAVGTVPQPICPQGARRSPSPCAFSPHVMHTYLEQTGNNYRCSALQHIWKVNREGAVRESSPPITTLSVKEMTMAYLPISESAEQL